MELYAGIISFNVTFIIMLIERGSGLKSMKGMALSLMQYLQNQ